ncbi:MAG: IS1595 family transposase [Treponema sp.]|nr:IS1595 family transposase [Treponema sp.]
MYPMNLMEFEKKFGTEESCRDYLFNLKYKDGYKCADCGCIEYRFEQGISVRCKKCRNKYNLMSGTIFQNSHKPLSMWFRAMWWITSQKNGTSALGLQRVLGIGSYKTAWLWLHKLRIAMVRPNRDKLKGVVEVDEAFIGGKQSGGKRGRGTENKTLVIIAVEMDGKKIGRVRMGLISDASSENLEMFIENSVEKGSTIITDGWRGYSKIKEIGYKHKISDKKSNEDDEKILPNVHLVISLLKRWIMGTLQGSISDQHMPYYLDEYTFRFNRRTSASRGKLFYRLIEQAAEIKPTIYKSIAERKGA